MSVILDALRRQRKGSAQAASAPPAEPRQVPAGLGLTGSSSATASRVRPARTKLLGLALLLVIGLGAWAAIRVARMMMTNDAPPAQSSASIPPVRRTPPTSASQETPVPPPPASVARGAPMTSPPTSEPAPTEPRGDRSQRSSTVVLRSAPDAEPQVQRRQAAANAEPKPRSREPAAQSPGPTAQSPEPGAQRSEPTLPNDGVNHFELAVRYHNLGNYDEALKHYLAVLAADEFNVEAHNNLGLLYHRRGMTAEAVDQFRRAIAINPQYVTARSNLAVVLMDAGRLPEARAELRSAMTLQPRNADLIVNLALVEKADQHRDQAIELLVRAIGYQPTHVMAHYNVGVLYEEQSALARAYDHYVEFLRYAGPERGELLSDVQRRLLILKPKLSTAAR